MKTPMYELIGKAAFAIFLGLVGIEVIGMLCRAVVWFFMQGYHLF